MLTVHRKEEKILKENRMLEGIGKNTKVLHDYIKNENRRDNKIGPFKIQSKYIFDSKEICKILVEQYNSEFSARTENRELDKEMMGDGGDGDLTDIEVSENSIVEAIGELAADSAAGCDGIPAVLLIKTKNAVAVPLKLILRKSLDEGKIHEMYKMAYVTPIHKGGVKA